MLLYIIFKHQWEVNNIQCLKIINIINLLYCPLVLLIIFLLYRLINVLLLEYLTINYLIPQFVGINLFYVCGILSLTNDNMYLFYSKRSKSINYLIMFMVYSLFDCFYGLIFISSLCQRNSLKFVTIYLACHCQYGF